MVELHHLTLIQDWIKIMNFVNETWSHSSLVDLHWIPVFCLFYKSREAFQQIWWKQALNHFHILKENLISKNHIYFSVYQQFFYHWYFLLLSTWFTQPVLASRQHIIVASIFEVVSFCRYQIFFFENFKTWDLHETFNK